MVYLLGAAFVVMMGSYLAHMVSPWALVTLPALAIALAIAEY